VPDGVLELFAIPDIRPDKILKLYRELGISSLAELEAAATEDRIRKVKGLGASLQAKILQNLKIARSGGRSYTFTRRPLFWSTQLQL
jgi:DNA polymerase (family 10)